MGILLCFIFSVSFVQYKSQYNTIQKVQNEHIQGYLHTHMQVESADLEQNKQPIKNQNQQIRKEDLGTYHIANVNKKNLILSQIAKQLQTKNQKYEVLVITCDKQQFIQNKHFESDTNEDENNQSILDLSMLGQQINQTKNTKNLTAQYSNQHNKDIYLGYAQNMTDIQNIPQIGCNQMQTYDFNWLIHASIQQQGIEKYDQNIYQMSVHNSMTSMDNKGNISYQPKNNYYHSNNNHYYHRYNQYHRGQWHAQHRNSNQGRYNYHYTNYNAWNKRYNRHYLFIRECVVSQQEANQEQGYKDKNIQKYRSKQAKLEYKQKQQQKGRKYELAQSSSKIYQNSKDSQLCGEKQRKIRDKSSPNEAIYTNSMIETDCGNIQRQREGKMLKKQVQSTTLADGDQLQIQLNQQQVYQSQNKYENNLSISNRQSNDFDQECQYESKLQLQQPLKGECQKHSQQRSKRSLDTKANQNQRNESYKTNVKDSSRKVHKMSSLRQQAKRSLDRKIHYRLKHKQQIHNVCNQRYKSKDILYVNKYYDSNKNGHYDEKKLRYKQKEELYESKIQNDDGKKLVYQEIKQKHIQASGLAQSQKQEKEDQPIKSQIYTKQIDNLMDIKTSQVQQKSNLKEVCQTNISITLKKQTQPELTKHQDKISAQMNIDQTRLNYLSQELAKAKQLVKKKQSTQIHTQQEKNFSSEVQKQLKLQVESKSNNLSSQLSQSQTPKNEQKKKKQREKFGKKQFKAQVIESKHNDQQVAKNKINRQNNAKLIKTQTKNQQNQKNKQRYLVKQIDQNLMPAQNNKQQQVGVKKEINQLSIELKQKDLKTNKEQLIKEKRGKKQAKKECQIQKHEHKQRQIKNKSSKKLELSNEKQIRFGIFHKHNKVNNQLSMKSPLNQQKFAAQDQHAHQQKYQQGGPSSKYAGNFNQKKESIRDTGIFLQKSKSEISIDKNSNLAGKKRIYTNDPDNSFNRQTHEKVVRQYQIKLRAPHGNPYLKNYQYPMKHYQSNAHLMSENLSNNIIENNITKKQTKNKGDQNSLAYGTDMSQTVLKQALPQRFKNATQQRKIENREGQEDREDKMVEVRQNMVQNKQIVTSSQNYQFIKAKPSIIGHNEAKPKTQQISSLFRQLKIVKVASKKQKKAGVFNLWIKSEDVTKIIIHSILYNNEKIKIGRQENQEQANDMQRQEMRAKNFYFKVIDRKLNFPRFYNYKDPNNTLKWPFCHGQQQDKIKILLVTVLCRDCNRKCVAQMQVNKYFQKICQCAKIVHFQIVNFQFQPN